MGKKEKAKKGRQSAKACKSEGRTKKEKSNKKDKEKKETFKKKKTKDEDSPTQDKMDPKKLEKQDWYFGVWPREKLVGVLKKAGNFVCRLTKDSSGAETIVVSVKSESGGIVHVNVVVSEENDKKVFAFGDGPTFDTVYSLIAHYIKNELPLGKDKSSKVHIDKGVKRPEFCLRHKEVTEKEGVVGQSPYSGKVFKVVVRADGRQERMGILAKTSMKADDDERGLMVEEARTITKLHTPDTSSFIINLVGLITDSLPMGIILEQWGTPIADHFKFHKPPGERDKLVLIHQLTQILQFITEKEVLHRSISSAHILVQEEVGSARLKLTQFSLAVKGPTYKEEGSGGKKPSIRWSAPEAIKGEFSTSSDVWSISVVAWECWNPGSQPYGSITDEEVIGAVNGGKTLSFDQHPTLNEIFAKAWNPTPFGRPSPAYLQTKIKDLLSGNAPAG